MKTAAALALALAAAATPALPFCRLALALAVDVSGSVDMAEYALQFQGIATALADPDVRDLLLSTPEAPVALALYEWGGPGHQRLLLPWTEITDATVLASVAADIGGTARTSTGIITTAVGSALLYGDALLAERPDCWRHTIDVSGDGRSNTGPRPVSLTLGGPGRPVTVNALVIGEPDRPGSNIGTPGIAELIAWFSREVVRGPGGFTEVALGFDDFADAMRRKLLKELATPDLASAEAPGSTRPFR
jgi:hypothetical protein